MNPADEDLRIYGEPRKPWNKSGGLASERENDPSLRENRASKEIGIPNGHCRLRSACRRGTGA